MPQAQILEDAVGIIYQCVYVNFKNRVLIEMRNNIAMPRAPFILATSLRGGTSHDAPVPLALVSPQDAGKTLRGCLFESPMQVTSVRSCVVPGRQGARF
ncbi:hypothetical protein AVEN_52622-1 [Araneus ventricosus]|uniref:Uncharacterized protein n=1 Tax=Araneus ventricosus TaxID=182803 RepID=A0A4Y2EPR4_ARAVE|nr:hypothetical protein AVEN_52622-1 [Araneus ventricosus]